MLLHKIKSGALLLTHRPKSHTRHCSFHMDLTYKLNRFVCLVTSFFVLFSYLFRTYRQWHRILARSIQICIIGHLTWNIRILTDQLLNVTETWVNINIYIVSCIQWRHSSLQKSFWTILKEGLERLKKMRDYHTTYALTHERSY